MIDRTDEEGYFYFTLCANGCLGSSVAIVSARDYIEDERNMVFAWNDVQIRLARLELLEAMLEERQLTTRRL